MLGLVPSPLEPAQGRENRRVESELFDELYNRPAFYAGMGALSAGAVANSLLSAAAVEFPAAGQPTWRNVLIRRPAWRRCGARFTIRYSATVGSTNNFVFNIRVSEAGDGALPGNTIAPRLLLPGPAVANSFLTYTHVEASVSVIPGAEDDLLVRFFRDKIDAGDTNANSLYVTRVLMEVLPR